MGLFSWLRRRFAPAQQTASGAPRRWQWWGGRRLFSIGTYIFPKDAVEGERLDLQHHLYKLVLGANYRAPIRQPRAILDVACGTGIWGREMALEFKQAQVIGFDLDRTPMEASRARLGPSGQFPANFRFIEADALKPFPFEAEQFDFAHARLISPFVPIALWPQVVAEMARVTRRAGYVEIVDTEIIHTESPAFNQIMGSGIAMMKRLGMHSGAAPYLADYLRQAGLIRVQERPFVLGSGLHAQRQQRLLIADMLAAFANMEPIMVKTGTFSSEQYQSLMQQARVEIPQVGLTVPVIVAYGMKPFN
ncbi:MAG TPA: methyltransferase domain-containing protein [Ktedonobacterales bacterium]|jgi:ubiquinone/menaquinone biosynthesis C-methylase UbiE